MAGSEEAILTKFAKYASIELPRKSGTERGETYMAIEMPDLDAMNAEADAWQLFVNEWRRLFPQPTGFDLNAEICNPLVKAIELWGENLALLRRGQSEEVIERAMHDKMAQYELVTANRK